MKKTIALSLILVLLLSFAGCKKETSEYKIDIFSSNALYTRGELYDTASRLTMKEDCFERSETITMLIWIGSASNESKLRPRYNLEGILIPLYLEITAKDFMINETDFDEYQYSYMDFSGTKYGSDKTKKAFVPRYHEEVTFKLNEDIQQQEGRILFRFKAISYDSINVYYAANSEKIVFSAISTKDAKQKLDELNK